MVTVVPAGPEVGVNRLIVGVTEVGDPANNVAADGEPHGSARSCGDVDRAADVLNRVNRNRSSGGHSPDGDPARAAPGGPERDAGAATRGA